MSRAWLPVLAVGLAMTSCHSNQAVAQPITTDLGQSFTLDGGQEATITGEDLRLRFDQVLEDSRCPKSVDCFWTGQARIALLVEPSGRGETKLEFNTNPAPGLNAQTARLDEFTVTLEALEPYPQTAGQQMQLADYRATFSVTKS